MKAIQIYNLIKKYNNKEVLNIERISICQGEIVTIIGLNGSGKTTLLKIISGLVLQDSGEVLVLGYKNISKNIKNNVKYVVESGRGYYDYLTARQNIRYFLKLNHVSYRNNEDRLKEYYKIFDFDEYLDKKVEELSQGNRQKLSLIIALMCSPKILCLDEPTNGLDMLTQNIFEKILTELSKKGVTILITTHDLELIKNISTKSIVLNKGKLMYSGDLNKKLDSEINLKEIITEVITNE